MGVINVIDASGRTHELEAVEGWRVMEIIREHGLPMQGTCGGACACATCHVVVDDGWTPKLHPAPRRRRRHAGQRAKRDAGLTPVLPADLLGRA
jgi:ferredoxin